MTSQSKTSIFLRRRKYSIRQLRVLTINLSYNHPTREIARKKKKHDSHILNDYV